MPEAAKYSKLRTDVVTFAFLLVLEKREQLKLYSVSKIIKTNRIF